MLGNENYFEKALACVEEHLTLPEVRVFKSFPLGTPGVQMYYEHIHTAADDGEYRPYLLRYTTIDCTQDFKSLLQRYFTVELAKTFQIDEQINDNHSLESYFEEMLENFVYDRTDTPSSIDNVFNSVKQPIPFGYWKAIKTAPLHPNQSDLFIRPCAVFGQKYEHWEITSKAAFTSRGVGLVVARQDKCLRDILLENGMEPILRFIIQLCIIQQYKIFLKEKLSSNLEPRMSHEIENKIKSLDKVNKLLLWKMQQFVLLSPEARKKIVSPSSQFIKENIDVGQFALAQHLPLLRMFYGHAPTEYYPQFSDKSTYNRLKAKAYFHLNGPIISKGISFVRKHLKKGIKHYQEIIKGRHALTNYAKSYTSFIIFTFSVVLMPFIIMLLMAMGLTSYPFRKLSRLFQLSGTGKFNLFLTTLESLKDAYLGIKAFILTYAILNLASLNLIPTMIQVLAAQTGLASFLFWGLSRSIAIQSNPVALMTLWLFWAAFFGYHTLGAVVPNYFGDFNNWVMYLSQYPWLSSLQPFSTLNLIISNIFIISVPIGIILTKINNTLYGKKIDLTALGRQVQNLNHAQSFRQKLGNLLEKEGVGSLNESDHLFMVKLQECVFNEKQANILENHINNLLETDNVEDRTQLVIAKRQLKTPGYFPSEVITKRLSSVREKPELKELREPLEAAMNLYSLGNTFKQK